MDNLSERTVLDHFLLTGQSSVPRLAEWCGVPPTTSLGIVRRLVSKGFIVRGPEALGGRGRPVVTYRPRLPQPVLACQFEGTELSGVLVTRDGEAQGRRDVEIHGVRRSEQAVEVVRRLTEAILAATGECGDALAGLSLVINAADVGGRCLVSSVLPWVNDSLEETFSEGLGMSVRVVRTPIRAVAEYQRRIDREQAAPSSIVEFNVADGASAHAIVNGRPLRGHCSLAGELGHVIVQPDGPPCGCGRRGCLEAFASGAAICRQVAEGLAAGAASCLDAGPFCDGPPRAAIETLWRAWKSGDTYAHAVMDVVLDKLGWGLGLVLNLFDPEIVAVRGYVLDGKPEWLDEVRRRAGRWTLHAARRDNRVEFAIARFEDEMRVAACDFCYPFDGV